MIFRHARTCRKHVLNIAHDDLPILWSPFVTPVLEVVEGTRRKNMKKQWATTNTSNPDCFFLFGVACLVFAVATTPM